MFRGTFPDYGCRFCGILTIIVFPTAPQHSFTMAARTKSVPKKHVQPQGKKQVQTKIAPLFAWAAIADALGNDNLQEIRERKYNLPMLMGQFDGMTVKRSMYGKYYAHVDWKIEYTAGASDLNGMNPAVLLNQLNEDGSGNSSIGFCDVPSWITRDGKFRILRTVLTPEKGQTLPDRMAAFLEDLEADCVCVRPWVAPPWTSEDGSMERGHSLKFFVGSIDKTADAYTKTQPKPKPARTQQEVEEAVQEEEEPVEQHAPKRQRSA